MWKIGVPPRVLGRMSALDETFGPPARMAVWSGRLRDWATRIEDQTEVSSAYASLVETRACPLCGVCAGVLGNNIERLRGGRPLRRLAFAATRAAYDVRALLSDTPSVPSRLSLRCKSCRTEFPLFKQGAIAV